MKTKTLEKKAALTTDEFVGLQTGRIARLHFQRASIEKTGLNFVMRGPSGEHAVSIASELERVNAHWTHFATHSANLYQDAR